MKNPYDEGSPAWELFEAGERLASSPASDDVAANASDRMAIALYRVGAALITSLDRISVQAFELTEQIGLLEYELNERRSQSPTDGRGD